MVEHLRTWSQVVELQYYIRSSGYFYFVEQSLLCLNLCPVNQKQLSLLKICTLLLYLALPSPILGFSTVLQINVMPLQ